MRHKFIAVIILLLVIIGGYFAYKAVKGNGATVSYVTSAVTKGTIVLSVSGSGQVSSSNQVDIKPKISGDVIAVYVTSGQEVNSGRVIAQIDTSDAARAVRDAQTGLETAKLEMDKLLEPADELTLFQAENALIQAQNSKQSAQNDLSKNYDDGFSTVANVFLNLPTVMSGMNDILFGNAFSDTQSNLAYYANSASSYDNNASQYKDAANTAYQNARKQYDKNFLDYKATSRFSSTSTIRTLIDQTYETTKSIAEMVKSANNLIQFYQDKFTERNLKPNSLSNTHITTLNSYTAMVNGDLSSLLSTQSSIDNSIDAITTAESSIKEKTLSLAKIKSAPDDLTIRANNIAIQQKEDALYSAQQNLADCSIRAPFGGVIAKVDIEKGDSVSSGAALATLVTKQKVAEISLNEVDAAKIQVGQKVTLTFDAIDGLSIAGEVAEVDSLGTVTQGVVNYSVKIAFDTQDDQIKPGMSVSAAIITRAKQDVLLVSNSAIKTSGNQSYVKMLDKTAKTSSSTRGVASEKPLLQQPVEIGLTNDSFTEITSGLNEGDQVVTQTITANNTPKNQTQQSNSVRIPGITGGGFR